MSDNLPPDTSGWARPSDQGTPPDVPARHAPGPERFSSAYPDAASVQRGESPAPSWAGDPWDPRPAAPNAPDAPVTSDAAPAHRALLAPIVIAALIGALVSGGIVALRRDSVSSRNVVFKANTSKLPRSGDVQAILAKVEPAVVAINTQATGLDFFLQPVPQQGAGTGFVVDPNGIIVTNNHVIAGAQNIKVTFAIGNRSLTARVLGRDASADLAVLKVDATGLSAVTLGDSDKLQVGDDVIAIGNALALPGGPTVTRGIISARNRTIDAGGTNGEPQERLDGVLQTDAAINPGNSGGPLVNAAGDVIGINTAIAGEGQNIGFAIAISQARTTIDQLRQGRTPVQPFLGVQTRDVTPALKDQLGLTVDEGALVVDVTSGSAADSAGVQRGDVIVEVDGSKVTGADDVGRTVRSHKPGDKITLDVVRNGNHMTLHVTIGQRTSTG